MAPLPQYPFSKWMNSLSDIIATKTIFEIIVPGAHKAAMSFEWNQESSTTPFSPYANDNIIQALQTLNNLEEQKDWAQRQNLGIYEMLMHGIRFLDLQFEFDGLDQYYAHNGLYGLSIDQILNEIYVFLSTEIDNIQNEIIIIYLSDFTTRSIDSSSRDQDLYNLYNKIIQNDINSYIIKSNDYDLTIENINSLTSDNKHLIIFVDEYPSAFYDFNQWFYASNQYFNIYVDPDQFDKPNITDSLSETQSLILNNLRFGWNNNELNLIYWMPILSDIFSEKYFYSSYFQFNAPFSMELQPFIDKFPKLWFANVLLTDFIESSGNVQQAIILNIKYSKCSDSYYYGYDSCSDDTDLLNEFYTNTISSKCRNNELLSQECMRSCGLCPIQNGYPGDECNSNNNDCDGDIYNIFDTQGVCGSTPAIWNMSYCSSIAPKQPCMEYWDTVYDINECGNVNLSHCHESICATNYDCIDGSYCHPTYSVCMTYNTSMWQSFASSFNYAPLRYWRIISDGAKSVLSRLEPLRPGNSSAPYTSVTGEAPDCGTSTDGEVISCVMDNVAVSPYMTSVIGLFLIPFILSIILCVCYCCLWPWWCCCENWSKNHCCHRCCIKCYDEENKKRCCCVDKDPLPCIGTPEDSPWIHWIPCTILAIAVIVSLWATIDGLISNSEIHQVIFDEPDSLQSSTDAFLTEVVDRLESVQPSVSYIISDTIFVLQSTILIISKTYNVEEYVNEMNENLNTLRTNYMENVDLTANVINPFTITSSTPQTVQFTMICDKCDTISDEALTVQDEFDKIIAHTLRITVELIQKFQPLYDVRQNIQEHASVLFEDLDGVITVIKNTSSQVSGFFETASELDSKYRETWIAFFLCFTLLLVVLPAIGILCKWKWCFKINWCCSMWLGTIIMFITSFAALIIVLWGDFCLRLDEFEEYQTESQFGQQLELDQTKMELVNACWTGDSILKLYGLDQFFNWDELRIGVKTELSGRAQQALYFDQLIIFKSQLETLSTDEFTIFVDSFIEQANNLGSYCGCGAANISFSRQNLANPIDECVQNDNYWNQIQQIDNGLCRNKFINASYAVQAEIELLNVTNKAIYNLQQDALNIFKTYDTKIYPLGIELINSLENLSCTVDPLFESMDELVFNFSNCGFIGQFYGDIKEDGCVLLFNKTYYIARALCVIAFMCIIFVFMSYCMDYVYGPPALKRKTESSKKKSYQEIPKIDEETNKQEEGRNEPGGIATIELMTNTTSDHATIEDDNDDDDHSESEQMQPLPTDYNYHYHNDKPSPQPIQENSNKIDDNINNDGILKEERTNITYSEDVKTDKDSSNESEIDGQDGVRLATEEETDSINFDGKAPYNYPVLNMNSHIEDK